MDVTGVIWIGGPAGAGKTTVARRLSRQYGLRWVSTDLRMWRYRDRAVAAGLHDPADPSPGSYDPMPLIVADLAELPTTPTTIVEGAHLDPSQVGPHAVWLMPSAPEQRRRLEARHPDGIDPGYLMGWQKIDRQLRTAAVHRLVVDGQSPEQTVAMVADLCRDVLSNGSTAASIEDRRDLVRWANSQVIKHALTGIARGGVSLPAGELLREFDCECGRRECGSTALLSVAAAAEAHRTSTPILTHQD